MTTAEGITLEGIGFNALGGSVVLLCSFLFFGLAVRNRNTNIAPRCAARNPNVIFNPDSKLPSEDQVNGDNNVISSQLSKEEIQYKGSAYFGWIPWCLNLSYDAMIKGIPGTGTRNGGMGGHLLKVNLDAIILIRFHEMCLKITCLATVLCLFLILPLNITARCYYDMDLDECSVTAGNRKLTNFERTTAYNIQPIRDDKNRFVNASFSSGLGRLYAIVIVSWILVFYALKLISREWVENLSLRRVFYLESSHWENRNEELEETWLNQSCVLNESSQNLSHCSSKKCDQDYSKKNKRDAWIPHPEQRDTLPNIDIYSVLVGRLPSSPLEVDADLEASIVARENPDAWRLETAYSFFDKCVPPENGFSSSVAAITILPDAPKLALAWRKWYRHADLLRKYIFLEELLDEKRGYTIEDVNEEPSGVQGKSSSLNSTLAYYDDIYGHGKFPGVMDFGPEQTAIYSREYAQGAAACCPYGCGEERLRISKIDDIEIEIEETKELLKESEIDWMDAMHKAAMNEANKNKDLHIDLRDKTTFKNEEQENQFKDSQEGNNNNFRRRANTNMSNISEQSQQWEDHVHNVGEYNVLGFKEKSFKVFSGSWTLPSVKSIKEATEKKFSSMWKWATDKTKKVVKDIHQETTFAVVTFTSRRAAVMARRCLLDGKGLNRWAPIKDIPVPPLADAASCDLKTCRGCCRPVTLTIGRREQQIRKVLIYFVLLIMFIFYTFPITAVAALADPEKLYALWPQLQKLENNVLFKRFLSGFIPALLFTLFFALCPAIFKTIANSGSNARSVQEAENKALQYFWYFMLVTAFTGSSLGTMTLNAINEKKIENSTFTTVLLEIAGTLPTQVSSTWLNWIIFRTTITLPLHYMLQINSFLFECLGWKCCQRCVRGGGPGGQVSLLQLSTFVSKYKHFCTHKFAFFSLSFLTGS